MSAFRGRGSKKPYSRPPPRDVNSQWVHDQAPGVIDTKPKRNAFNGDRRGPSNFEATSGDPNTPNSKLLVSNLHYEITPKDLAAIFGQIGTLVREPMIRYDRSGRSSGTAIVSYETVEEATKAKKQFHGILAKGQPMEISYDNHVPRHTGSRRVVSAPTTSSLINRIQKPPLADRLHQSTDDMQIDSGKGGVGPIRSKPRRGGAPTRTARGGAGAAKSKREPKKPKTAEELDKELDAFMGDAEGSGAGAGTPLSAAATAGSAGESGAGAVGDTVATATEAGSGSVVQDVEMA